MKYFTMEELDYIAKELIENPSKETLKRLNDKYNGEGTTNNLNWVEAQKEEQIVPSKPIEKIDNKIELSSNPIPNLNMPIYENQNSQISETSKIDIMSSPQTNEELVVKTPVWEPITNSSNTLFGATINNQNNSVNENKTANDSIVVPNLGIQNNNTNSFELPNINTNPNLNGVPSLDLPKTETPIVNNNVPFTGNLWETNNNGINTMMQTTDNFNAGVEHTNNNEIRGANPFFQPNPNITNNPIPVSEPPKVEGPTMFGQFEQNFNNNAA